MIFCSHVFFNRTRGLREAQMVFVAIHETSHEEILEHLRIFGFT